MTNGKQAEAGWFSLSMLSSFFWVNEERTNDDECFQFYQQQQQASAAAAGIIAVMGIHVVGGINFGYSLGELFGVVNGRANRFCSLFSFFFC